MTGIHFIVFVVVMVLIAVRVKTVGPISGTAVTVLALVLWLACNAAFLVVVRKVRRRAKE